MSEAERFTPSWRALALIAIGATALTLPVNSGQTRGGRTEPPTAGVIAGGGSWITFLSNRTGQNLLYRMRPDGAELKAVFGGRVEGLPGISPKYTVYLEPHWSRVGCLPGISHIATSPKVGIHRTANVSH